MNKVDLYRDFVLARKRSVPIIAIDTPSPLKTIQELVKCIPADDNGDKPIQISWDPNR